MAHDSEARREGDRLALVDAIDGPSPAAQRLSRSLEGARRGDMVHVDERGDVRGPGRDRLLGAANLVWAMVAGGASAALCAVVLGPVWGGVALAGFGGALALEESRRRRVVKVSALIAEERLVEAEALCCELIAAQGGSRALRAAVFQNLAVIAARRGEMNEALIHVRSAIRQAHSPFRRSVQLEILAYHEIRLLAAAGRGGEARARMQARAQEPQGDYLGLLHATADLCVRFVLDDPPRDEDQTWERARLALRSAAGTTELLALSAWAFERTGDADMAAHLVGEAQERVTPAERAAFAALWAWVDRSTARSDDGSP